MNAPKGTTSAAIFVLHGSGRFAVDMFSKGFDNLANVHGFLVIYPEMKKAGSIEWGYPDDIPFFTELIHRLQKKDYMLDPKRAFICGHSAGGSMSLFMQNEVDLFRAAGAVEAAVGHLWQWDFSKRGHPTMIVWNHADPVLTEYAPYHDEPAYYDMTVSTLRRHGSKAFIQEYLPTSKRIVSAELRHYPRDTAPQLRMLSFSSDPGTHSWANTTWATFSATEELVKFFLEVDQYGDVLGRLPTSAAMWFGPDKTTPNKQAAWHWQVSPKTATKLGSAATWALALAASYISISTIFIKMCKVCKTQIPSTSGKSEDLLETAKVPLIV
jgi:poly(3-hydroxybutyrate) depolymerase